MSHPTARRPGTEQTNSGRAGSTADVIILGGGGAGLSAAVSAAENGASVILLQKAPTVGGTTAMSVGAFTAAGSSLQKAAGIADSVDEFIADIQSANGPIDSRENHQLRQVLSEQAAPTLEWLIGMGVRFLGPFSAPSNRHPRMHNVLPNSRSFTAALAVRARKLGARIETNRRAEELLIDDNHGVIGVRAGSERYHAVKGVVWFVSSVIRRPVAASIWMAPASYSAGDGAIHPTSAPLAMYSNRGVEACVGRKAPRAGRTTETEAFP
jgi:predicted oxidoreductase